MIHNIMASFGSSKSCVTASRYRYDYGQQLVFKGIPLPDAYEVHFSNEEGGQAKTVIGDADGALIPDEYFLTGETIYAWLFLHDEETDGRTMYKVKIPVINKAKPIETQPTPVEQDVITQAIAALNHAVEESETNVTHYPKIEDGTWRVWDAEAGAWNDTGIEAQGEKGDTGNGIESIVFNADYSMTITFTDGTTFSTPPVRGEKGENGDKGDKGDSIKGDKGDKGDRGERGETGNGIENAALNDDYTLTLTFTDGTTYTTPSIRGDTGEKGDKGDKGETGPQGATGPQGPQGEQGPKGDKGDKGDGGLGDAVIPWDSILPVDTASGAIVTIPDGTDLVPAKSLKVQLEPIQEGSGTPSPDNVRPISGHTSVNVTVSPTTEAEDGTTYTTDLGQTVYGGTLDVVSGELVVDRAMVDLGTLNWTYRQSSNIFRARLDFNYATDNVIESISSAYPFNGVAPSGLQAVADGTFSLYTGNKFLYICNKAFTDATTFKASLSGQTAVIPLATPQTYQLTPQTIALLKGANNVWGSGDVTLVYNADIQRYISKVVNA